MTPPLTHSRLRRENLAFTGTGGVSRENRNRRFEPAFRETSTGRVERSRYADGRPAPMHLLDGLPDEWIETRDDQGAPRAVKADVIAGFVRDGNFYTREQAAALTH